MRGRDVVAPLVLRVPQDEREGRDSLGRAVVVGADDGLRVGACQKDWRDNEKVVILNGVESDKLNPSERIIRRFGGQSALANLLGKRQSTVEHWASTGRIPAQWQQPLMSLARQKGIVLEARDFVATECALDCAGGRALGVLLVGLGAVSSTFIAGVEHARRGTARPFGSLTQMGTIRLGKREDGRKPLITRVRPAGGTRPAGVLRLGPDPRQRV